MFVVMNRMGVPADLREKFEQAFLTRAKAIDRRPGFIRAEILRPTIGDEYVIMSHWETAADFEGWVKSEEFAEGHRRMGDFKDENGKVRLTSQVVKYEVFAT